MIERCPGAPTETGQCEVCGTEHGVDDRVCEECGQPLPAGSLRELEAAIAEVISLPTFPVVPGGLLVGGPIGRLLLATDSVYRAGLARKAEAALVAAADDPAATRAAKQALELAGLRKNDRELTPGGPVGITIRRIDFSGAPVVLADIEAQIAISQGTLVPMTTRHGESPLAVLSSDLRLFAVHGDQPRPLIAGSGVLLLTDQRAVGLAPAALTGLDRGQPRGTALVFTITRSAVVARTLGGAPGHRGPAAEITLSGNEFAVEIARAQPANEETMAAIRWFAGG